MNRHGTRSALLRSEQGEKFLDDITLIQLGLDILEGSIAKSGQADLKKKGSKGIGDQMTQRGYMTDLLCQTIYRFGRARLNYNGSLRVDA